MSADDVQALRTRVDHLREVHATSMTRCATVLERSRSTRRAVRREVHRERLGRNGA
jgi:hypothetical protein